MSIKCPKCDSKNVETERRLGGDSTCIDCKFTDKTVEFYPKLEGFGIEGTTSQVLESVEE